MQLRYMNADALIHDIQVPAVQVEPLQHKHVYEVATALGLALLASAPQHWKEVLPKEDTKTVSGPVDTPASELRRVKGIGAKTATALAAKGIDSLHLLVDVTAEDINALLDGSLDYVTVDTISAWQEHARQLMEE